MRRTFDALRTLLAAAGARPTEPYEVVIDPDGSIVERRDHVVTVMDLARSREFR